MDYPTYVQLGQFTQATAMRANVMGLLTAPAITLLERREEVISRGAPPRP
jgi:hypothetical protein